jgi:hypothetical protein
MMGELSFRDMSQMGKVHLMMMMMKVVSMTIVVSMMMIMMTMMVKTMIKMMIIMWSASILRRRMCGCISSKATIGTLIIRMHM